MYWEGAFEVSPVTVTVTVASAVTRIVDVVVRVNVMPSIFLRWEEKRGE